MPICRKCMFAMQEHRVPAIGLMNDNFIGYMDPWVYEEDITWMEKTVASPFWTGMTLFSIDSKTRVPTHKMLDPISDASGRVLFKGQIFSAPLDWEEIREQLENADKEDANIELPLNGKILAARVRISIASGLVALNRLLRQATVRRAVVVRLIQRRRDAKHPDYQSVNMHRVQRLAQKLAPTNDPNEPYLPDGLLEVLQEASELTNADFAGTDKAATPAERNFSSEDLARDFERARPQVLVAQRDSDANKDVVNARLHALEKYNNLSLGTGSTLEPQFLTSYIPRMFSSTIPWCVGGPDFPRRPRQKNL